VDTQDHWGDLNLKYEDVLSHLSAEGTRIDRGLSETEFAGIESAYGFRFPPDLRQFLSIGLPLGEGWLDWRRDSRAQVIKRMNAPLEGICLDVRRSGFWHSSWGAKPRFVYQRISRARRLIGDAPKLIPLFGHRYIPDRPCSSGNPVFSVVQTDIIHYGKDLISYLVNEFFALKLVDDTKGDEYRPVEFWSDLANTEVRD